MSAVHDALIRHAESHAEKPALIDEDGALSYGELLLAVERLAGRLLMLQPKAMAIFADNSKAWAVTDLAALLAEVPNIPLPLFFSPAQMRHALAVAGVDLVVTDQAERFLAAWPQSGAVVEPFFEGLQLIRLKPAGGNAPLPPGTVKVTFTSGTTGEPKGVCLAAAAMDAVATSLAWGSEASPADRHLCLLPLATLLENIGGVYTPLLTGATLCVPPLAAVGLSGSSGLDVRRLLAAIADWRATTAIMVPQMLQAVVAAARAGLPVPDGLRYLAVGGAPLSIALIDAARAFGLPVYEGYGLSECASVIAVNSPAAQRPGSVGKPLPHIEIRIAADGEIEVAGQPWLGYLGQADESSERFLATGDLGYLDADGYLFLTGRKKNIFITSFGRNVAPEWVERELLSQPGVVQAAIFGEARPFNCAVIVPMPGAPKQSVVDALAAANRRLPDYARVHAWIPADEPFTPANGLATANGRLRRSAIHGSYAGQIDALYQS